MESINEQVEQNGYAFIEDFLTEEEIIKLKSEVTNLINQGVMEKNKSVFSADSIKIPQASDRYFIDSANKISLFYEVDVFNEDGILKMDPQVSLNKIGHALHKLNPVFKEVTFHEKVKDICRKLRMKSPTVIQSMYIFKNPKIGGKVRPHQDASYLYTEPYSLYGFWFALDDATEENGCLWFIPGSHNSDVQYRFIRNPDKKSEKLCLEQGSQPTYDDTKFKITPVKKGTCIIIHGNVVHLSLHNNSNKPRHAYTFHVYDSARSQYSQDNWLQTDLLTLYEE